MHTTTVPAPFAAHIHEAAALATRIRTPKRADGEVDLPALDALYEAGLGIFTTDSGVRGERLRRGLTNPQRGAYCPKRRTMVYDDGEGGLETSTQRVKNLRAEGKARENANRSRPVVASDDLLDWLLAQTWSEFAQSLAMKARYGPLTNKQVAAAERMRAKCEAREQSQPQAAPAAPAPAAQAEVPVNDILAALGVQV